MRYTMDKIFFAVELLLLVIIIVDNILPGTNSLEVLNTADLDGIVQYIREKNCKNIITMAGAGISTAAGIPDFRTPGTGLYDNLQQFNLPTAQSIFDIDYFRKNPKPFFVLAKQLYPSNFRPTVSHYFIRLLQEKGLLLRHYTQNIDTLERVAGVHNDKLVEAHGSFYTSSCMACSTQYTMEWSKEKVFADEIPTCDKCGGVVKPDVVFFGELLPPSFAASLEKDFPKCDLLIIMGSSLQVYPFASLKDSVSDECPRLLINRERPEAFGSPADDGYIKKRDVFWEGMCDDGCQLLADKLGWGEELKQIVKEERKKIDEKESNGTLSEVQTK